MRPIQTLTATAFVALALGAAVAGCGSSGSSTTVVSPNAAESSPPGDIPDNQAFVPYKPPSANFSVKVPEGWSRTTAGNATTFTDKLNSVTIESTSASAPLTVQQAKQTVVPQLSKSAQGFAHPSVSQVTRMGGTAILIAYDAQGKADPVTGKSVTDAVERYTFFHNGTELTLTLSGPKGADNVDPWRIITDSVRWS